MKQIMKPGEVAQWEHKRIRCVDGRQLTQATRCQRCYFRYHALCGWLHCIGVYYIHPKEKKRKSAKKQSITQNQNIMEQQDIKQIRETASELDNNCHKAAVLLVLDSNDQLELTCVGDDETINNLLSVLASMK